MSNKLGIAALVVLLFGAFVLFKESRAVNGNLLMYKTETCGCCNLWGEHMKRSGFKVQSVNVENLTSIKSSYQVSRLLVSCHTAVIEGYVIEGHVPAREVKRLLSERPDAIGLAVAGMPIGSPGMEMENHPGDFYDVILFKRDGSHEVYASYR